MPEIAEILKLKDLRKDFPILKQRIHGKPLVYLDNAATTQKPQVVIDRLTDYYQHANASIHRGIHDLSEQATIQFEQARVRVQRFIGAKKPEECIFVKSATEAINLVAYSFGEAFIQAGDEILISALEHHANIVPWQLLCERKKAHLKVIPVTDAGELVSDWENYLTIRTKLLAITHVSNAIGTVNPIAEMIARAHAHQIPVLVDGAQSVSHLPIDVQALDCDFFVFSGHKLYGPTGIGVLYGKRDYLERMPPYQGGGHMILSVDFEKTTYNELPHRFEAGTPPIASAIALATALEYLEDIGWEALIAHEQQLMTHAREILSDIPGLRIIGTSPNKVGLLSFIIEGIHAHDIGSIVDRAGIAIRTGHHCAMPLMKFFKVPATARISFGVYNTREEIDRLKAALYQVLEIFSV